METRLENVESGHRGLSADKLVADLKGMVERVENGAVNGAKATDKIIRENPYQSIGVAFGLGMLLGFVLWRK